MGRKKSEKHTTSLGMANSMAAAASLTGLDASVISSAKDAGCEAFRSRGDVDCDKLLLWLAEHPEIAEEQGSINKTLEEALKIRAGRLTIEHKLAEAKRRVIPSDEVKRTYTRSILALKSKHRASEKTIAMKAKLRLGLNDEQIMGLIEIVSEDRIEIDREMAKGEWVMQKCPHCDAAI